MVLNVSTKTGDQGQTSLANGERLAKDDVSFELIGTLDELNSQLGLVRTKLQAVLSQKQELAQQEKFLQTTQKQLFVLGAVVAKAKVELSNDFLKKIEAEASKLQNLMADDWHNRFVLPGGHEVAALLDIARAVCRRLERVVVSYVKANKNTDKLLLQIINRLSDYLYVLRCFVNEEFGVVEHYV